MWHHLCLWQSSHPRALLFLCTPLITCSFTGYGLFALGCTHPRCKKTICLILLFTLNKRDSLPLMCYIIKLYIIFVHLKWLATWPFHIVNVTLQQHLQIMTVRAGIAWQLNTKIHWHNLPFYQLVNLFYQEANIVDVQAQLIADGKLKWVQCLKNKNRQRSSYCGKIMLWNNWMEEFLCEVSKI